MKNLLTVALLFLACAVHAQTTPPAKTDTAALFNQFKAAVNTYNPIWILITNGTKKVAYMAGFQRGDGVIVNMNKTPLSDIAIIFGIAVRKVETAPKTKP